MSLGRKQIDEDRLRRLVPVSVGAMLEASEVEVDVGEKKMTGLLHFCFSEIALGTPRHGLRPLAVVLKKGDKTDFSELSTTQSRNL